MAPSGAAGVELRRRAVLAGLLLAGAVALAGHWAFWYRPRVRPAALRPSRPSGQLLVRSSLPLRVWVPFPHQNLGALERGLDDSGPALAAAARLLELATPELPRFGPFAVPPARALALATEDSGGDFELVVEVYPVVALLARAAGVVAGNPLLSGGPVTVSGRRCEVSWSDRAWHLRASALRDGGARDALQPPTEPGLAVLALAAPRGPLGAGTYLLRRRTAGLERAFVLQSSSAADMRGPDRSELTEGLALFGWRRDEETTSVLLVPPPRGGGGSTLRLPDAAVLWRGGERRWKLPGESIARFLGLDLRQGRAQGWRIVAMEAAAAELARARAGELAQLLDHDPPSWFLVLEPRAYLGTVAAIADLAEKVPLVRSRDAHRWRDLATVLEAVPEGFQLAGIVDGRGRARLEARWFDKAPTSP